MSTFLGKAIGNQSYLGITVSQDSDTVLMARDLGVSFGDAK